jgi:tRNA threonylcarbamoyladenosine biosynthesis protein TsaE
MKTTISTSVEQTENLAKLWIDSLNISDEATVVGLYGNLGSGKTTFTQSVGRALGVKETMTSPTFVIQKSYETKHPFFKKLIHIDAYRLKDHSDLKILRFDDLLANNSNLILVEWPEIVKEILPDYHHRIYCEFVDETTRKFQVQ